MEQKTNALKTSSKVIAIMMKIGYIAMIVAMCVCVGSLIFMAATGGKTSIVTSGGTTIGVTSNLTLSTSHASDATRSTAEHIAMFSEYFVMSALLFVIFLLAQRMFCEISATGDPFTEKYVKTVRAIGILVAATTLIIGITEAIVSSAAAIKITGTYAEAPGIGVGAIIFCLSYIIDYGRGLKERQTAA